MAIEDERFNVVQLPYNHASAQFQECVRSARAHSKELLINRPFQMGQVATREQPSDKQTAAVEAFRFILQEDFEGVVLTGTSNVEHLRENIAAFCLVQQG